MKYCLPHSDPSHHTVRIPCLSLRRALFGLLACSMFLSACQARPSTTSDSSSAMNSEVNQDAAPSTTPAISVADLPPATFTLTKSNDTTTVATSYSLQFDGSAAATPLSAIAVRITFPSDQSGQTVQMTEEPFQVNPQLKQNGWLVAVNTITQNPADGSQSAELALINTKPDGLLLVEPTELATLAVVSENPHQTATFDQQTTQVVTKDAQLLPLLFQMQ